VTAMPARARAGSVRPAADRRGLRFALTPVFLDDRLRVLQRWRQYLATALGTPVEFVQRGTYAQVMDVLRSREVDFAWICGYPYVLHQHELKLVSVPLWRGRPLYQSYLIVDAHASGSTLSDLRGRRFAYSDPLSNSGFLYVQHRLRRTGNDPGRFFGRTFFTYSHRHVVEAVADGLADAGAVDGYVWETLAEIRPRLAARTRIIERSPDFGFPPVVSSAGAAPADASALVDALRRMSGDEIGREVLAELRLDGFADGTPSLFDGIAAMAREQT
jgi:phosphonate transport system substrate-binding protein